MAELEFLMRFHIEAVESSCWTWFFLMRLPVSKNEIFLKRVVRLLDLALLISFTHFLIKLLDLVNIKAAFSNFSILT